MANLTTSSIPTVKAALVAALAARPNVAAAVAAGTLHVSYCWDNTEREELIFLDPPQPDRPPEGSTQRIPVLKAGRMKRHEDYTVVAAVRVAQPLGEHTGAATAEARAFALFAEVENLLADDPNLGGVVGPNGVLRVSDATRSLTPLQDGWLAEITAEISVSVRLS